MVCFSVFKLAQLNDDTMCRGKAIQKTLEKEDMKPELANKSQVVQSFKKASETELRGYLTTVSEGGRGSCVFLVEKTLSGRSCV